METRYQELYRTPKNIYLLNSPIVISVGVLQRDTTNNKIFAQLKIKSLSTKKIKAITVVLFPLDTADRPLGDSFEYKYLDLNVLRDQEFGQKTPIFFSDINTRRFSTKIKEVIFESNEIWIPSDNEEYCILPDYKDIANQFNDKELLKQYKIDVCPNAMYQYMEYRNLWYCNCGRVNLIEENKCYKCGADRNNQKDIDFDRLELNAKEREAKEKEAIAKKAEEDGIKKSKRKRNIIIAGVILFFLIFLSAIYSIVLRPYILYRDEFESIVVDVDNGSLESVLVRIDELETKGYSKSKISEIREEACLKICSQAIELANSGEIEKAEIALAKVSDYPGLKDEIEVVRSSVTDAKYKIAVDAYNNKQYKEAISIFEEIQNFGDAKEYISDIRNNHILQISNVGDVIELGDDLWIVVEDTKTFIGLLSKYIIDKKQFNNESEGGEFQVYSGIKISLKGKTSIEKYIKEYCSSTIPIYDKISYCGLCTGTIIPDLDNSIRIGTLKNGETCEWWLRECSGWVNAFDYVDKSGQIRSPSNTFAGGNMHETYGVRPYIEFFKSDFE